MQKKLFFCFVYGNLAEFLKILHKFEGGLASACASGFVTLNYLCLSIGLECLNVSVDFFNKCFHKYSLLKLLGIKSSNFCCKLKKIF